MSCEESGIQGCGCGESACELSWDHVHISAHSSPFLVSFLKNVGVCRNLVSKGFCSVVTFWMTKSKCPQWSVCTRIWEWKLQRNKQHIIPGISGLGMGTLITTGSFFSTCIWLSSLWVSWGTKHSLLVLRECVKAMNSVPSSGSWNSGGLYALPHFLLYLGHTLALTGLRQYSYAVPSVLMLLVADKEFHIFLECAIPFYLDTEFLDTVWIVWSPGPGAPESCTSSYVTLNRDVPFRNKLASLLSSLTHSPTQSMVLQQLIIKGKNMEN